MDLQRFDARRRWTRTGRQMLVALIPALMLVAAAAPSPASAVTELVVNGSFEEPRVEPGTFLIFDSIPGWQKTSGCGIEVQRRRAGTPLDGEQLVELGSTCASAMAQTIPTVPGATYNLSFYVSPRPNQPANENVLRASWDGAELQTIAAGDGGADTAWVRYSYTVVAGTDSTSLAFADIGPNDSLGAYIDLVSVTQAETVYDVCLLYDPLKPKKAGSVVPIKLQLCDATGANLSDPSLLLHVVGLTWIDPDTGAAPAEDAGQANPGDGFRYDADLTGYIFNLDTNGLASGTWQVRFMVNDGAHVYTTNFDIK